MRKKIYLTAITLALGLTLTACSASDSIYKESINSSAFDSDGFTSSFGISGSVSEGYMPDLDTNDYNKNENVSSGNTTNTTTNSNVKLVEEKLVYRANISLETLNYDTDYTNLKALIKEYGGIIENETFSDSDSYLYNNYSSYKKNYVQRNTTLTVRIPTENYENFLNLAGSTGKLISKNTSTENITRNYYNTQATVDGLKLQLERLQELLKAATDVYDMIELNREISSIESEINRLTTTIITMDMDVAYSYVNINLNEVIEYSETEEVKQNTFLNRFADNIKETVEGFGSFLEGFLFLIIRLFPYAVLFGIIAFVFFKLFGKKIKAAKEKDKEEQELMKALLNGRTPEKGDSDDTKKEEN